MTIKPKQSRSETRAEKRHRYSIRKFNQGVASVAIGAFMFLGATGVSAEEVVETIQETTDAVALVDTTEPVEEVSEKSVQIAEVNFSSVFDDEQDGGENYTLHRNTTNVTRFVDEKGNEIAAEVSGTVNPISIAGYVAVSTASRTSGGVVETVHTYHQLMTYWVDQNGQNLRQPAIGTLPDEDANDLSGYILTNIRTSGGDTYNVYRPAGNDDVTSTVTRFVDESGNAIATEQAGTVSPLTIAGYQHIRTQEKTGVNGSVATTYIYHQIITKYVDEKGASIQADKVGSYPNDTVSGYVLTSYSVGEQGDVTNVYRAETPEDKIVVENVTKFIDEAGTAIATQVSGTVDPIAIDGYFAIGTTTRTKGDSIETTHTYHRIVTTWVDESGKELKASVFGYYPDDEGDDIAGYSLVSSETLKNSDVINTYRVTPEQPKFTIEHETRFVDELGNVVAASQSGTVAPIEIAGYFNNSTSNRSQTIGEETRVETTHVYHQIVTNYVDESGQAIQAPKVGSYPEEEVTGYTLVSYSVDKNADVTNVYRVAKPEDVVNNVTHFVDEKGNTIAPDQSGTVSPIAISGYFNISTSSRTQGDAVETTHVYHQVVTKYVDEKGASIQADKVGSYPQEEVSGYTLVSYSVGKQGDVTNVYRAETPEDKVVVENVTHFVDEKGNTIAPDQTGTVSPINISGYFAVKTSSNTKGQVVETTHIYHQIVTNWVDESGKVLKAQEIGAKPDSDDDSDIEGYQLVAIRTLENGDITNVYHQLVTNFVDENGQSLRHQEAGEQAVANIDGYTWIKTTVAGNGDVTHIYRAITSVEVVSHVTHFVDESGKQISADESGVATAKTISGYVHLSSSSKTDGKGNTETTHVYRVVKAEDVVNNVTHFVDEQGNTIAPAQSGQVSPIAISGYFNIRTSKQTKGDVVETTHVYRKVIVVSVDEAGSTLVPDSKGNVEGHYLAETKTSENGNVTNIYKPVEKVVKDSSGNVVVTVKGTEAIVIPAGYRIVNETVDNKGNVTVTVEAIPSATNIYVDEQGNTLTPDASGQVPGYKLVSTKTDAAGNMTYVYAKESQSSDESTKSTSYVDEQGNTLTPDASGQVPGYKLVSTKTDAAGNTTYVYTKVASIGSESKVSIGQETKEVVKEQAVSEEKDGKGGSVAGTSDKNVISEAESAKTGSIAQSKTSEQILPTTGEADSMVVFGLGLASLLGAATVIGRRKEN